MKAMHSGFGYGGFRRWLLGQPAHSCIPSSSLVGKQVHDTMVVTRMAMSLYKGDVDIQRWHHQLKTIVRVLACTWLQSCDGHNDSIKGDQEYGSKLYGLWGPSDRWCHRWRGTRVVTRMTELRWAKCHRIILRYHRIPLR